ncbi:MAG: FAD-binding protein [Dehalococcoidia bacterium]|nr:MAG: FAD-binding protein [Dehalococcoidia bacterium]
MSYLGYPDFFEPYIKKVEQTRPARVEKRKKGEEFPFMSLEERQEILKHHPDYKEAGRREIKVGPNKGYRIAHEFVDLLEAKSKVDPDKVDLTRTDYETDVLVIGGGGAATIAALIAEENSAQVVVATKLRHGDANTMMAEGGIQAASKGEKDSPYYHYLDVMGGGHFKNDSDIVAAFVKQAPDALRWLESLGVMFSKFPDGRLDAMHGGGTCRKRMHYCADLSGLEIMRTVRDEARNRTNIKVLEFSPAVELIVNEHGQCAGALLYNMETEEYLVTKAKAVILATGGAGRLHVQGFMTTNHYGATADGIVLGYRAGVPLAFMHTVQYHPTGVVFPEQIEGWLITERFRSEGSDILNVHGEKFVNEREPRDVESARVIKECLDGKGVPIPTEKVGIWLDSPMLDILHGERRVRTAFVGKWKVYDRLGIDISKAPMLVYPTLHYQNGGLKNDAECETAVPGLYVAGEVTGGLHGENRLMGNSLMDLVVFGRIAGRNAAIFAKKKAKEGKLTLEHVKRYHKELEEAGIITDRVAPMLLPDYTRREVKEKQLTAIYLGLGGKNRA